MWRKLSLFFLLLVSAMVPVRADEVRTDSAEAYRQKVYYFEHRLLPKWAHGTNGQFFSDLQGGDVAKIAAAATKVVDGDFAKELTVKVLSGTRVLITFPKPRELALCFFVVVEKRDEGFRYFTLELTEDMLGDGTKTVVGEWDASGGHKNFGPRTYVDAESFIADLPTR